MSDQTVLDPTNDLVEQAKRVLPGGSFGNMPAEVVLKEGKGGRIWDEAGREYVDFLLGSGPMFVGHAHPEVTAAVQEQVPLGTTFFGNNRHGIALAEAICDAVPCADQVRFVCSGTEADLYAMRAVRAFRKRDKILKFEGGYHGMSDYALMSLAPKRPGNFPRAIPDSAGIPKSVADEMLVAAFNDIEMVESLIEEHKDELAGVIVEPFQRLIPPKPGFLQALRDVTRKHGIPLIFDEVVTGFRFAYGGAQEYYGVTPDLCSLGKIVGGGFALAAIAGRADIMKHFDRLAMTDEDFIFQVGTLSGNPVAAVAGPGDTGDPEASGCLRAGVRDRPRADGGARRAAEESRHPGAGDRRAAAVRRRLHRPADQGLSRHAEGRQGDRHALQPAFTRTRHHEGRVEVLRQPRPHPRRHRPYDRGVDRGGEGAAGTRGVASPSSSAPPPCQVPTVTSTRHRRRLGRARRG